ncbi:MAG: HipA domain-containing protein [Chitinophagaceae bacterium]
MKEKHCLYCYQPLPEDAIDFHEKCSRKFFGTTMPPTLDYCNEQMQELAKEIVIKSVAVTGVQPKLSLTIEKTPDDPKHSRFTIVGLWGNYILKPPTEPFPHLPENEDLTMHLAEVFDISVAMHSLIRLKSGELAYITKRIDRIKGERLPLEDMCQLTETLTNDKYRSSMEKIGKCISNYSTRPGLDNITFFEIALFSFLTGNADMHLKNFSLLTTKENDIVLAPAYDLVSTKIAMPDDLDEMALTINGRKRRLEKSDFDSLASNLKIPAKAMENSYAKFAKKINVVNEWIKISFLPTNIQKEYRNIITENAKKIGLL